MARTDRIQALSLRALLALLLLGLGSPLAAGSREESARYLQQAEVHMRAARDILAERGTDDCQGIRSAIEQIDLAMTQISAAKRVYPVDQSLTYEQRRQEFEAMQTLSRELNTRRSELVKLSYRAC